MHEKKKALDQAHFLAYARIFSKKKYEHTSLKSSILKEALYSILIACMIVNLYLTFFSNVVFISRGKSDHAL